MPINAPPFIVMLASAARTASGNGDTLDLSKLAQRTSDAPPQLRIQANFTAVSGTTPSLTLLIEDSIDGVNFNTVGTFTAATTVSRQVINIGIRGDANPAGFAWPFNAKYMRCRWTVTGTTPSFTFSVVANLI